ncbi:Uncharacterised protein [Mycobacteroides abscessus subsp. abscessus]|nr:Uncharacterised protein [Mycobacteroides abscessus subsp. abscessus]
MHAPPTRGAPPEQAVRQLWVYGASPAPQTGGMGGCAAAMGATYIATEAPRAPANNATRVGSATIRFNAPNNA